MPMSWWFCSERLPFYWCKRLPRQREELDFQWFHPWPKQLTASAHVCRLQNSPYFCVFKYARAVKQKVWNEAENRERDWRETLKIRTVRFAYVIFVGITHFSFSHGQFPLAKFRCKLSPSCQVMFSTSHSRCSSRMYPHFRRLDFLGWRHFTVKEIILGQCVFLCDQSCCLVSQVRYFSGLSIDNLIFLLYCASNDIYFCNIVCMWLLLFLSSLTVLRSRTWRHSLWNSPYLWVPGIQVWMSVSLLCSYYGVTKNTHC